MAQRIMLSPQSSPRLYKTGPKQSKRRQLKRKLRRLLLKNADVLEKLYDAYQGKDKVEL